MCGKADPNMTAAEYYASAGVAMGDGPMEAGSKMAPFTPMSMVPILHLGDTNKRIITPMRWGWLTPNGKRNPDRSAAVLHCRSETIEEKNMWQAAFVHARGVM